MKKTPNDVERDIRARVLRGESYESAADGRVVKATVARIINDLRKDVSDFDELRELNTRLRREGRLISDVLRELNAPPIMLIVDSGSGEKNMAVEYLEFVLASRWTGIPCRNCNLEIMVPLESAEFYRTLLWSGQWLSVVCPSCGWHLLYSPFEVLGHFALSLLEKDWIIVT